MCIRDRASHESDITGPDYDLNAEYLADAKTPAELAAILGVCIPNIEFSGSFAAEASGSEPVLTIDYDAVIDLKGFEFTVNGTGSTNGILLSSGSSTIRNLSLIHIYAITAVIVGGTSFLGGIGTVTGALIGSIIVGLINNILNLLHVSTQYQLIVKGLLIAVAVIIDIKTKENKKSK